ncbi:MAG: AMP-binding protein [Phormidium tanganyikae FI6-MK23]|jgi:acyl-CoA synthetase (AMP-forming)/AMP-acid ligase II/acyl carrier protein|nr:AMP-binding protein [Phormidium tanganyikae FI6-MK23]
MQYLTDTGFIRFGIVAANNTGYVEAMFRCMEKGNIAIPLRGEDDQYRIDSANIDKIITPTNSQAWMRQQLLPVSLDQPALISFTSGTEGVPKGVVLTHTNLTDVVARLNSLMQLDHSISEYIGVPVYHSFGFGRCRAVATAGGRFFIPSNGFNPSEISEMLKQGEINAISAVPSLWRVLLTHKDLIGRYGRKVRWIEIGSQYMSRQEKEEMKILFPEARIIQHYGLTEASRTTLLEIHEVEGDLLESVGRALGSVEIQQRPEGQIAIRGDHIALRYLINGQETPLKDQNGWFLTKDLGHIENGHLFYKGRADDVINCGGLKVAPEALEAKIYAHLGSGKGMAICRKPDPIRGDGFLVAFTPELGVGEQELREVTLKALQEIGVNAGNATTVIPVETLPRTDTGKIQRKKLSELHAQSSLDQNPEVSTVDFLPEDTSPIRAIFCRILNRRTIKSDDTFVSLGGDSLSYIQMSVQLEKYLGEAPARWECKTLKDLESIAPQQRESAFVETDVLIRTIAIFGVVLNHATLYAHLDYEKYLFGGAIAILMVSGLNFARFQGHKLFQGKVLESITPILRNLLIPYLAILIPYQILKQDINLPVLLLFDNFLSGATISATPFPYWFISLLVQLIIIFAVIFSIKPIQRIAKSAPFSFGIALFIAGVSIYIPWSLWQSSQISNNLRLPPEFYLSRTPERYFRVFALGWCLYFAKSRVEKRLMTVILTGVTLLLAMMWEITSERVWLFTSGMLLLWTRSIPVPIFFKLVIQAIASSTLYIYMTHMLFITILIKILGINNWLISLAAGLLGSLFVWFVFSKFRTVLASVSSSR